MAGYIIRRLIQAVPILFGVAVISFGLVYLAPGDPIDRFRTPTIRPDQLEGLIELYGLDRPLAEQFWAWITSYVQIWRPEAWGYSFLDGQPVLEKVAQRLPATVLLGGTALLVTVVVAIPLGILAAVRQYSTADRVITSLATIGYAIPSFLLGLYLLYFGGVVLGWFPLFGLQSFGKEGDPLDMAWHLVLPVASLAIQQVAGWSRYVRASMLEVLHQDFVRTAHAKGLPGRRVTFRHGAAQRAHPDHHPGRAHDPDAARRRGHHRGDLQLARRRPDGRPGGRQPRLPGRPLVRDDRRHRCRAGQPAGRHRLRRRRSANQARMTRRQPR